MLNRGLDKLELLRIAEAVANEKSIDKEIVLGSMESAIQKAALTKFGNDNNIEVKIDRENGNIKIQKVLKVVDKVEDPGKEIDLKNAKSLENNEVKIIKELNSIQGTSINIQGYYSLMSKKAEEAMRPSPTLNNIIEAI